MHDLILNTKDETTAFKMPDTTDLMRAQPENDDEKKPELMPKEQNVDIEADGKT